MEEKILGWHFLDQSKRLGHIDGRLVKVGETISVEGDADSIAVCSWGLHCSKAVTDALAYTNGQTVYACRVEVWGDIDEGYDKVAGRHRRVLWMVDCRETLEAFARSCALDVAWGFDRPGKDKIVKYLKHGRQEDREAAYKAAKFEPAFDTFSPGELEKGKLNLFNDAAEAAEQACAPEYCEDGFNYLRWLNFSIRAHKCLCLSQSFASIYAGKEEYWCKQEARLCNMLEKAAKEAGYAV